MTGLDKWKIRALLASVATLAACKGDEPKPLIGAARDTGNNAAWIQTVDPINGRKFHCYVLTDANSTYAGSTMWCYEVTP